MTISRVSSSDNLYKVLMEAEINTKNIVHSWHLEDGDKAYLIHDNGNLKTIFLRGENRFIEPISLPGFFSVEEAVNRLLEWYPILADDNSIKYVEYKEKESLVHSISAKFPFQNTILCGEEAFYNQHQYFSISKQELSVSECLPVSYTWNTEIPNTEHKMIRIAKKILPTIIYVAGIHTLSCFLIGKVSLKRSISIFALPVGIYKILQIIAGTCILPIASPLIVGPFKTGFADSLAKTRSKVPLINDWKYIRKTIEVDGCKIDSVMMGKPDTFANERWLLASNGNGEFYEGKLDDSEFKEVLSKINCNALLFNPPGVGANSGSASVQTMSKVYRAMFTFLENAIRAKKIVGYGFSIGGAIQGEALKTHPLKKDVKYVFVKDRTFSTLSQLVSQMMGRILGFFIKPLGWEMDSLASSKSLQVPEIILQTTTKENFHLLESTDDLSESDGVIKKRGSLAFGLLKEGIHKNKHYLGTTSNHNDPLDETSIEHLSAIVNQVFAEDS
ncbi:MAG: CPn0927/CPn0928 family alpha/beta hydrolase fold protein [Candidatus Rhabdochlamydia sp.]